MLKSANARRSFGNHSSVAAGGGSSNDPNFASVVLLMHCDGTDASTTFPDSSAAAHTMSAQGNAQVDTADKLFGTGSLLLDATGDGVQSVDSADWSLGTAFTIEFAINPASIVAGKVFIGQVVNLDAATVSWYVGTGGGGQLILRATTTALGVYEVVEVFTTAAIPTGAWVRLAVSCTASVVKMFFEGVDQALTGTATLVGAMPNSGHALTVGNGLNLDKGFAGPMDEIRVTKGVGRYTASYTPAAAAFPNS